MKAFVLSAGMGKRLLPYTLKTPKSCMPFLNIPLVAFNLQHLLNIGVTEFIFNTHHLSKKSQTVIAQLLNTKASYHFSHEVKLLNSAGGLKKIESLLKTKQDFLMVNADSLCLGNSTFLKQSIASHKKNQALASLVCCPSPEKKFQTIKINKKNNQVLNIGSVSEDHLHYTGYMIVSPKIFPLIKTEEAHIFMDVLLPYIKNNLNASNLKVPQVFTSYTPLWKFFEMGNITDFKNAERECSRILTNEANSDWRSYLHQSINNFSHEKI